MNTQSVTVRYRPIRIGWCIRSGDFAAMREALRLTFTMWGGRYNPLIPVDDFEFASSLVRLFRVDVLWPISKDEEVKNFIDRFPHLSNPFFTKELFVSDGYGNRDPRIVDIYHPIRRLYEEHFKNNPTPDTTVTIFEWQIEEDPLADVLLATLGAFPTADATGTDYISLLKRDLSAKTVVINPDAPLPQFSKEVWPVSTFSRAFIQQHYQIQNYWGHPGVYVGRVDNFEDQITFWNLRATNISLMFYDPSYASRFQSSLMMWLENLRSRPSGRFGSENSIAIWLGDQMAESDIAIFGQGISRISARKETWNGFNIKAPYMYFSEATVLAVSDESTGGFPRMSFQLPPKPFFEDEKLYAQHMIVSVDSMNGSYSNEQTTFQIPFVPELNEYYGRQCCYQINGARAEPNGLGIVSSASGSNMFLDSLNIMEFVKQLFLISGIDAKPSTPGLIATRLIQQMGGLQGCRVFKIGGVRELIEQYKPDKSFTRSCALQIIRAPTVAGKPFDKYKDFFIEQRSRGIDLKPESVLAYLLERSVFRAGLVFDCPSCTLDFWISLDDIGSEVSCEYCGHAFNATPLLKDRDWRFRRSGLFGRDNNQEGAIPVILTLQQLDTLYRGEILFATAMKLKSNNANALNCETDFVAIAQRPSNGKINIAIGECKTRQEISEDDVNNLQIVADSFSRDKFNVFIIFSKLTSFSPEELERIRRLNSRHHRRVILLTSRELEPYFLYDETSKEFEIDRLAISFEDMVKVTKEVFFSQLESK